MDISIVIPLYNEEESLPELYRWLKEVIGKQQWTHELLFVDDGSTDGSWKIVEELSAKDPNVRGISFRRNYGKSAALNEGFNAAQGDVVVTMDADLQDSPDELPELFDMVTKGGFDLVSGWKKKRHDPISKTVPSKLYNKVTGMMTGTNLHDMNCGLKAYKHDVIKSVEIYGEMHRYIPVMAKQAGFKKIGEKVVEHRARKYGVTKFGLERFIFGFLDLLSILFVTKFGKRPMHLFGSLGSLTFFFGFLILLWLSVEKLVFGIGGIATRPMFFLGLITIMVGTQLFLTGFLAELVSRSSADRNDYQVRKRL